MEPSSMASMRRASISWEGQQRKKVYANGSTYVGSLDAKGRRHGRGVMVFKDGTYEGDWRHGKQTGFGTYQWLSGSRYQGEWLEGRFEGKGTYTWPSGATYTGEWKNGRKHGQGRFLWPNGTVYEGQFQEDKKMGFGEYTSGSDNTKYIGEYIDDKMHGEGTYLFSDGARYVGQFANNNFDGLGCYTTPDGTSYVGQFKDDQRHGVGLLKPPHLGTFKVRYIHGKIVEHQDIVTWLKENECGKYVELFQKEEITFDVVVELTEDDLLRLGVVEFGKRKKLLTAIEGLPNFRPRSRKSSSAAGVGPSSSAAAASAASAAQALAPTSVPRSHEDDHPTTDSDQEDNPSFRLGTESDDGEDDDLSIQAEDHYADLGDGLVLETEEKQPSSMSAYRKSSEFSGGELDGADDLYLEDPQAPTYRLIHAKELRIQRHPIGRGVFGVVYSAEWRGAQVAVKKLVGALGEKELAELHREAHLLEKLCHHPHVVNYLGLAKIPELCLVTQFYPKGSVYDIVIKRRENIGWKTIVGMARDAAAGIYHLHCERVIHRDIATRNCLADANYRVVVTDFGLSRVKTAAYCLTNNSFGPVSWMAPEALMERKFSEKSDAYSFGILLWELVARKAVVYPDETSPFDIATVVIAGKRPTIPDACPKELRALMVACWAPDPAQRPDFARIEKSLAAYYYSLAE